MLSWPDVLCELRAAGGRRVVRVDLRDSGESTTADPESPAYALRALAADAAALVSALGGGPAYLAGIGIGASGKRSGPTQSAARWLQCIHDASPSTQHGRAAMCEGAFDPGCNVSLQR